MYVNNDMLLYSPVLEYKDGLLKREYLADGYIDGGRAKYELVSLGGGVRVFDDNGTEVGSVQYDSFGNVMGAAAGGALGIDHWKGEFLDPDTGLVYLRNRWYDPMTGRWLSDDPIGISGGLNQYVAFNNNPVNFRDLSGLCTDVTQWQPIIPGYDKYWNNLSTAHDWYLFSLAGGGGNARPVLTYQQAQNLAYVAEGTFLVGSQVLLTYGALSSAFAMPTVQTPVQEAAFLPRNAPLTAAERAAIAASDSMPGLQSGRQIVNTLADTLARRGYTPEEIVKMLGPLQGGGGW